MNKQDSMYWRYKKNIPPIDENADKNGPVRIIKPAKPSLKQPPQEKTFNFFTCSKCGYAADGRADFNDHWELEH